MNADSDRPSGPDDALFDEAIAFLKRLEPSLESRIRNRVVVAEELKPLVALGRPADWWRRSISIPLPLAAAMVAVTAIAISLGVRGGSPSARVEKQPPSAPVRSAPRGVSDAESVARDDEARAMRYYANETYLCGLGPLRFESGNFRKEQKR
jgi:hypothetical protein